MEKENLKEDIKSKLTAREVKNLYILRGINPQDGEIIELSFCASDYKHATSLATEGRYLLKPKVIEGIQGKNYLENRPYGILR